MGFDISIFQMEFSICDELFMPFEKNSNAWIMNPCAGFFFSIIIIVNKKK